MVDYYYLLINTEMCKEACVLSPVVQHVMLKAGWLQATKYTTLYVGGWEDELKGFTE